MNRDKRFLAVLLFALVSSGIFLRGRIADYLGAVLPAQQSNQSSLIMEKADLFPAFPVNVNIAGMDELMSVPGIGKKTAEAIIRRRTASGDFRSVDDLARIVRHRPRFEKLRPFITITLDKGGDKVGSSNEG